MRIYQQIIILCLFAFISSSVAAGEDKSKVVRISVANSFSESGLLQSLITRFQKTYPQVKFEIHTFGSLAALNYIRHSDIDLVISHYPNEEKRLLHQAYVSKRTQIMFSKYAVFGPVGDEYNLSQKNNISDVLKTIAEEELPFIAPSPLGGTYRKIEELWALASINPDWPDYEYSNLSSSAILKHAALFQTYAISEMGIYLSNKKVLAKRIAPLYQNDVALQNIYSVLVANQEKNVVKGNAEYASLFYNYLISKRGQDDIRQIGQVLFNALIVVPAASLDVGLQALEKEKEFNDKIKLLLFVIIVLFLLLISSAYLFSWYRKNKNLEKEQLKLEKILQQKQKMESLGQLAGGIAHDFNNVLSGVIGYSGLAAKRIKAGKTTEVLKYLEQINKAGKRANDLVSKMLAFSRRETIQDKEVQLSDLINGCLTMLGSLIPSSVIIETELEDNIPTILLTETQLQQVLMNLCINARDAMQDVGKIVISLSFVKDVKLTCSMTHKLVKGDWVSLSVSDTGEGIDEKIALAIFDPFFTTKDVGKGSGLGLAVIYGIMKAHHGHIIVTTEKNKGTRFQLLFPKYE